MCRGWIFVRAYALLGTHYVTDCYDMIFETIPSQPTEHERLRQRMGGYREPSYFADEREEWLQWLEEEAIRQAIAKQ